MGGLHVAPVETPKKRCQLDTMSRIFNFSDERQANFFKEELQDQQKKQKQNHIRILEVKKIVVEQNNPPEWKVGVLFQFPQWSLRSYIIDIKKDRQHLPIGTIFQLLSLFYEFLSLYKDQICEHFDIFSHIFVNEDGFKICYPFLLYSSCPRWCDPISKQTLIKQILELVLLEKTITINYWQLLDKIQKLYPDSELYNLFSFIMQTQTTLDGILLRYQINKNRQNKEQEQDNLPQLSEVQSQTKIVSEKSEPFFFNLTPVAIPQKNQLHPHPDPHPHPHRSILNGNHKCSESMIKQEQHEQNNSEEGESKQSNHQSYKLISVNPFASHGYTYSYQEEINNIREDLEAKTEKYIRMVEDEGNYEGYIVNGLKEGEGVLQYFNGIVYKGTWRNNLKNGYGQLFWPKNFVYNGFWKDDLKHGKGQIQNLNISAVPPQLTFRNLSNIIEVKCWRSFTGFFVQNMLEGQGQLTLSNGDKFKGNWKQDKIQGKGQYLTQSGKRILGLWDEGELIGSLNSSQSSASISQCNDFEFP